MSIVPATPPIPAGSVTPVPPPTTIASSIPDDMLYEVVDGRIVEKKMSAGDRDRFNAGRDSGFIR